MFQHLIHFIESPQTHQRIKAIAQKTYQVLAIASARTYQNGKSFGEAFWQGYRESDSLPFLISLPSQLNPSRNRNLSPIKIQVIQPKPIMQHIIESNGMQYLKSHPLTPIPKSEINKAGMIAYLKWVIATTLPMNTLRSILKHNKIFTKFIVRKQEVLTAWDPTKGEKDRGTH